MFVKFNSPGELSNCQNVNESFVDSKRIEPTEKSIEVETPDSSDSCRSAMICESIDSIRNNTLQQGVGNRQCSNIEPADCDDLENAGSVGQ